MKRINTLLSGVQGKSAVIAENIRDLINQEIRLNKGVQTLDMSGEKIPRCFGPFFIDKSFDDNGCVQNIHYLEALNFRISVILSQFIAFLRSLSIVRAANSILSRFLILPAIRIFTLFSMSCKWSKLCCAAKVFINIYLHNFYFIKNNF